MLPRTPRSPGRIAALAVLAALAGCVERTVKITTEPEGATVFLNDEEVGRSPVEVPFTWYGDYDIIVRKKGFETLKTHRRLNAPWYQWPIVDFFAECLVPFTIHDEREIETLALAPKQPVDKQTLLDSAEAMKARALSEAPR